MFESSRQSVFECKRIVFIIQILTLIHGVHEVVILSQILHVTRLNLLRRNVATLSHVVVCSIAESEPTIFLIFSHLVSD